MEGVYAGPAADGPKITFGFSKDHRPDLRQIKIGSTVTQEGIPLAGDVFDGNETDQTWNEKLLDWLEGWIGPEKRQQTLFVADSALITGDNLRHLDQGGYRFVSRLPDTFGYATVARSEALHRPRRQMGRHRQARAGEEGIRVPVARGGGRDRGAGVPPDRPA
ncbi:transposase, partial [mine drainage metagenome]